MISWDFGRSGNWQIRCPRRLLVLAVALRSVGLPLVCRGRGHRAVRFSLLSPFAGETICARCGRPVPARRGA